jgi:hypothetical protein
LVDGSTRARYGEVGTSFSGAFSQHDWPRLVRGFSFPSAGTSSRVPGLKLHRPNGRFLQLGPASCGAFSCGGRRRRPPVRCVPDAVENRRLTMRFLAEDFSQKIYKKYLLVRTSPALCREGAHGLFGGAFHLSRNRLPMVDADHWRRVRALRPVALVCGTTRLRLFGDEAPRRRGTKTPAGGRLIPCDCTARAAAFSLVRGSATLHGSRTSRKDTRRSPF